MDARIETTITADGTVYLPVVGSRLGKFTFKRHVAERQLKRMQQVVDETPVVVLPTAREVYEARSREVKRQDTERHRRAEAERRRQERNSTDI